MKRRYFFNRIVSVVFAAAFVVCPNIMLAKAAEAPSELISVPSEDGEYVDYSDDEKVTVIVELDSKSLLERDADIISSGDFTKKAQSVRGALLSEQSKVLDKLEDKINDGKALEKIYSYTILTNAFATEMCVGQIEAAASVDGIKSVYIAPEFEALDEADGESLDPSEYAAEALEETGYTGAGTVISIIDTGIDIDHDAFANAPASPKISQSDVTGVLSGLNAYSSSGGTSSSYYYSEKIPFFYNYANKDFDVSHVNVAAGDHGTHVAGIAAGCAKDEEGNVTFSGVAPDAQILVMKVFKSSTTGSTGASTADLIAAIEDSLLLGADVINYSLGSIGGFSYAGQSPAFYNIFDDLDDAGIAAVSAAGNSYTAGYGSRYGNDLSLASNPDNGSLATPASYDNNFAVASFAKTGYIVFNGVDMDFTNNYSDYTRNVLRYLNQTHGLALLRDSSGTLLTGSASDFLTYAASSGIAGKFVMVRRGQSFIDTAQRASDYGAIGLIVCNNKTGALSNMAENTSVSIPAIFISQENGDYIVANYPTYNTITVAYAESGQMSPFSSVGVTPELQLKPEISALGGSVFSATDNNTYGLKSGTSMAAPYFSGAYAVVLQYFQEQYPSFIAGLTAGEKKAFVENLLMSTAEPMTDELTSSYYSPRRQGSGAVDVDAAMASKAVLMSSSLSVPKLSLGDDPTKTGVYTMSFVVSNFSDTALQFTASAAVLTELVKNQTVSYQTDVYDESTGDYQTAQLTEKFMSGSSMNITPYCTVSISDGGNISVPAGGNKTVTVTVTVGSAVKSYMDSNFENGIYVDGFIMLDGGSATADLSIPYLAFYGDWSQAPVLDEGTWQDALAGTQKYPTFGSSAAYTFTKDTSRSLSELYKIGTNHNVTGQADLAQNDVTFNADRMSLASRTARSTMTSDQLWNNTIYKMETYLLRSASLLYRVSNADTGELYGFSSIDQVSKTYYKSSTGEVIYAGYNSGEGYTWNGKTTAGKNIPDGTRVRVDLVAGKNYGTNGTQSFSQQLYSFEVLIDATVPELRNVNFYRNAANELCGTLTAYDAHYINSIEVTIRGVDGSGNAASVTKKYVCGFDEEGQSAVYNLNLTQATSGTLAAIYGVDVETDDWAGNGRFNNSGSGTNGRYVFCFNTDVSLAQTINSMTEGESFDIVTSSQLYQSPAARSGANDNAAFNLSTLKYISSDPTVVTVDKNGKIYGVSAGTATITLMDVGSGLSEQFDVTVQPHFLQALVNAASSGDTVVYDNGDVSGSVVISKDLTVDLNGATITSYADRPAFIINNGANVTIKNGCVKSAISYVDERNTDFLQKIFSKPTAISVESGSLTLNRMTVTGASYCYNGTSSDSAVIGNGVTLSATASLNVQKSDIYGLYAVNNAAGSTITMTDGNLFGVLSAARLLNDGAVAAAEGSKLYDILGKISDILTDGSYTPSTTTTVLGAAINNASYQTYLNYLNGTLTVGLEFNNTSVPEECYGYAWIPSELYIMKDGETATTIALDGSEHCMYELTGMPQGDYSINVCFKLSTRLTDEQNSYLLNTNGALSAKLESYNNYLTLTYGMLESSFNWSDFFDTTSTIKETLQDLDAYFNARDLLGADCPLTQDCADVYMPGRTGLGLSDAYGLTWEEYYTNYLYYVICGGTAQIVTQDGEYITPHDGETFTGILPMLQLLEGDGDGSGYGTLNELRDMASCLGTYNELAPDSISEKLAYLNDTIASMFEKLNDASSVLKSDSENKYNSEEFDTTVIDTLLSDNLSFIFDGSITSFTGNSGFTHNISDLSSAVNTLISFNAEVKSLSQEADYLNFSAYSDCGAVLTVIYGALDGVLNSYISDGCLSLFSEVRGQSETSAQARITYHGVEGATNDNPNFYTVGEALTLKSAVKPGYYFNGWFTDADCDESSRITAIPAEQTGDVALYASFTLSSFKLRFVADGTTIRETTYQYGQTINETSPDVPTKAGYTSYWDKYLPSTMPPNDYVVTAVYFTVKGENQIPVGVEVIGGGSVSYGGKMYVTNSRFLFTIGNDVTFTASENDTGSFLYWVRKDTNRIVSTSLSYTFTAASAVDYEAVFCTPGDYHNITFQGSYGNILGSTEVEVGSDDFDIPTIPVLEGRNVIGWDKAVKEYKNIADNVLVTAQYETVARQYTVTLTNTENVSGAGSYDALSVVTITATDENFSYWTDEQGTIVSYQSTYSFIICFDCTFTAVFEGAVTPMPVIRISKVSKNLEEKNLTFYAERSIPTNYTVLETGMILTNLSDVGESESEFTLDNPYVLQGTSDSKLNAGTYSVMITDYTETDIYYARGYVILKDSGDNTLDTLYSAVAVSPPDW